MRIAEILNPPKGMEQAGPRARLRLPACWGDKAEVGRELCFDWKEAAEEAILQKHMPGHMLHLP